MKRENKNKCEFVITGKSKKLTIADVQNATLSLFGAPMSFPEENLEFSTLEEFILGKDKNER